MAIIAQNLVGREGLNSGPIFKRQYVANQTGKRYKCESCGSEFIVTRGGNGTIMCCDKEMVLK